jgi:hypothetical protein
MLNQSVCLFGIPFGRFFCARGSWEFGCFLLIPMSLAGCFSPSMELTPNSREATKVTVSDLVDHIACQLGEAYAEHHTDPVWQHLVSDNFVAQIDLTLTVTQAEGFNPSINLIKPLTGNGGKISPIVYSGMGATTATNNQTLALGLQLNGTQDRNIEQDYTLDMRRL